MIEFNDFEDKDSEFGFELQALLDVWETVKFKDLKYISLDLVNQEVTRLKTDNTLTEPTYWGPQGPNKWHPANYTEFQNEDAKFFE